MPVQRNCLVSVTGMCVNGAMNSGRATAILAMLFGLAPALASATGTRPLQLELPALSSAPAATSPRPSAFTRSMAPRPAREAPVFHRNGAARTSATNRAELAARAQDLGRQALENVFDPASMPLDEERGEGRLQLKFNKRGNAFKDLGRSYREMCDRASQKIWDDPDGKRIRFDVAGRPGVGFEIPVGHRGSR